MFRKMFSILFVLVAGFSFAQGNITKPIPLSTNLLAHSALLPENLQLFSQDTASHILFNPSRAANYNKSFIFFNYLPHTNSYYSYYPIPVYYGTVLFLTNSPGSSGSSGSTGSDIISFYNDSNTPQPAFSFASLFNYAGAKWLFTIDNKLLRDNANSSTMRYYYSNHSDVEKLSQNGNFLQNSLSAKLSYIGQSSLFNYSAGLFFINDSRRGNSTSLTNYYHHYYSSVPSSSSSIFTLTDNSIVEKINIYKFGLEFGFNKNNWDYKGRLSYQTANEKDITNRISSYLEIDSTFVNNSWIVSQNSSNSLSNNDYSTKPYSISLENFFSHSVSIISPEDNIFLSVNAFTSRGTIIAAKDISSIDTGSTRTGSYNFNTKTKDWGIDLSAGYVLRKTFSDLFILSGINISAGYNNFRSAYFNSNSSGYDYDVFNNVNNKYSIAYVMLPIYINYSPAKWISIIGGLNYYYSFNEYEISRSSEILNSNSFPVFIANPMNISSLRSSVNSLNETFIGLELRHFSGLQTQIAFNQDITHSSYWNFSVGYSF